jgi:hypothetical protein
MTSIDPKDELDENMMTGEGSVMDVHQRIDRMMEREERKRRGASPTFFNSTGVDLTIDMKLEKE